MATSPIADNYIENIRRQAFTGYSTAGASNRPVVPNPMSDEEDVNRSYTQFAITRSSSGSSSSQSSSSGEGGDRDILGQTLQGLGVPDPRIDKEYPNTIAGYIESKIVDFMGVPQELNPLTGTVRATGVPKAVNVMMGPFMGGLAALAGAASQKNLESIFAEAKKGTPGYGVGLLDNQIVGYSPGILAELGFGPVMSGMVDNVPPGLTAAQHQQNIIDALAAIDFTDLETIPDITAAYNIASYGAIEGANIGMGTLASQGVVYSYTQNPYGAGMIKTPVTSGTGTFVTTGSSPWAGYGPSDVDFDPTFGYTDVDDVLGTPSVGYDDVGTPIDSSVDFDADLDVSDPTSDTPSDPTSPGYGYGDPSAPGGGEFDGGSTGGYGGTDSGVGSNDGGGGYGDGDSDSGSGTDGGGSSGGSTGSDSDDDDPGGGTDWATGGRIGMQNGGTAITEGFVNKNPSTVPDDMSIADNRYTSVKAGSFVINQPANEANKEMLDRVVGEATKRTKMKIGGKVKMVDVALSDGERLIEPEVVATIEKKYGKGFLDKINDAGKPEVKRRQAKYGEKIGAAVGGGFLADQGMELGDVGEDIDMEEYLPVSDELKAKLSKFASRKPQRGQIKQFIRNLSPEEKLTVLFLTETKSTTDPIESMEAIGEVVKNRIGSDYYDFKGIKTLDDALLKQTRKGAFHFSGLEPSTFYARAKEVKKGVADKGLARAYAAAQNVLDPETEGQYRLPANTVFYTRKDAPSQWMRESKDLEFSTELGEHEFYRTFASPELP
jgi:hypothetical protein